MVAGEALNSTAQFPMALCRVAEEDLNSVTIWS